MASAIVFERVGDDECGGTLLSGPRFSGTFEFVLDSCDVAAEVSSRRGHRGATVGGFERVDDNDEAAADASWTTAPCAASAAAGAGDAARLPGCCNFCGRVPQADGSASPLRVCGGCRRALYCSSTCQRSAWQRGHRFECGGHCGGSSASTAQGARESEDEAAARLVKEAAAWQPPTSASGQRQCAVAELHCRRMLPVLLEAHAGGRFTEHHISGLLDREDLALPPHSQTLAARLHERLRHAALAECLEDAGDVAEACGACARAALSSHGWADIYHRWGHCLELAGRASDIPAMRRLAVQRGVWQHVMQRPNDLYVPGLRAKAFWTAEELPAARQLQAAFPSILREYRALRGEAERGGWTPVADQPLVLTGDWADLKLVENGKRHPVNCARCPETLRLVQECCPEVATQIRGSLIFSRLAGGTRIRPHCGPNNVRIRIHLALEVPQPAPRIRVGQEWATWEVGRCLVFDDSFEHEVVHEGKEARAVLIADAWHPDFGEDMRQKYLRGRHWRRYREACDDGWHAGSEPHRVVDAEVRFLEAELRSLPGVRDAATTVLFDEATGRQTLVVHVCCAEPLMLGLTVDGVCDGFQGANEWYV